MATVIMSENTGPLHYDLSAFRAHRGRVAQTVEVTPPQHYALPGSLVPIHVDRLEAHQEDGLDAREIVEYENARFLEANAGVRERHAQWVGREYNAMVQAHREIEQERQRQEAEGIARYHARVAELMAERDADA